MSARYIRRYRAPEYSFFIGLAWAFGFDAACVIAFLLWRWMA